MSCRGDVVFWPEMSGQTLTESMGGRLYLAALWSVGSTPASSEKVRYLEGKGRQKNAWAWVSLAGVDACPEATKRLCDETLKKGRNSNCPDRA